MTRSSHSQDDCFTIKGQWWLPETTRKVAGDLIYDVENMTLALYGGLNDAHTALPFSATPESSEFSVIHGESLDRVPITILGAFYTKWTPDIRTLAVQPGTHVALLSSELTCHAMVHGSHLLPQDEAFIKCRVEIPYLDNWLGDSPFKVGMEGAGDHVRIDYARPGDEEFTLDDCDCVVRFVRTVRPPGFPCYSPSIEHRTDLEIEAFKPMPLRWFQQHASEIVDLFSFLYGGCILSRRVALIRNADGDNEATLYWPRHKVKLVEFEPMRIMVRYKDVKDSFARLLKNWVTASEVSKRARRIVLSTERRPSSFIELRFLPLVHAAELLTRESDHTTFVDQTTFANVVKQMIAALPANLPSQLTTSIKSSLGWANGRNLKSKLKKMLDECQDATCNLFCGSKEMFVNGIVDARNYYTHYSAKTNLLQGAELHWAIQKTLLMLRLLLLLKAGVAEEELQQAVHSHYRLAQERAVWSKITEEGSPFGKAAND